MSVYNFLVSGPKFTILSLSNKGGNVVDQVHFRFSICGSVPEILAIKVESWVQTHMYYFMDSGPKFTGLVWLNAGGIARDHMSFRFLISCLFSEIYAIRSEVV